MHSKIHAVARVALPEFRGDQLYMHHLDVQKPKLPAQYGRWASTIEALLPSIPMSEGIVYLTIDEKQLVPGQTHRRGGAHIDGIWNPAARDHHVPGGHIMPAHTAGRWQGGYWDDPKAGGGLLLLSNVEGCRGYLGEFDAIPGEGGDMQHVREQLDAADSFIMEPNIAYLCNVWAVHESIPVARPMNRSLIRLTLPEEARV
jgi:hypothetical protein